MSKKTILLLSIVGACLIGGGVAALAYHKHQSGAAKPVIAHQKQDAPKQTAKQAEENNKPSQDIPVSNSLAVTNIKASQKDSVVTASADITQSGGNAGDCVFTFTNDLAKPVVREVTPTANAGGFTCNTGNINNVEFSVIGTWKLTVNYYYNGTQANGNTTVDIQ